MDRSASQKSLIPYIGEPLISDYQALVEMIKLNGVPEFIDKINWKEISYRPVVQVFAGYSNDYLWLYYEVKHDFFRIKAFFDQEAVWEDSCVEFFMSSEIGKYQKSHSGDDIIYRNFEFNPLGVCLSACGTISCREMLSKEQMERILRFAGLNKQNLPDEGAEFDWELCVGIPLDLLELRSGRTFKANYQKCGDLTYRPHYVTWSAIESATPDFHLPQFFGDMELVR